MYHKNENILQKECFNFQSSRVIVPSRKKKYCYFLLFVPSVLNMKHISRHQIKQICLPAFECLREHQSPKEVSTKDLFLFVDFCSIYISRGIYQSVYERICVSNFHCL